MPNYNGYNEVHPERESSNEGEFWGPAEARATAEKQLKRAAPMVKAADGIEFTEGRIFEPRCGVCVHPYRDWIEMMLIRGSTYKGLQDRVPPNAGHKRLDRRSISNHHKNHMDLRDAALRAILEREAEIQGEDWEEGVTDAITKRGVLEIALRKGYEDILSGAVTVEPRDLIQITKVLADMDTHQHQVGLDEIRVQMQMFIQAIREVCDVETQNQIGKKVKQLRKKDGIQKQIESVMTDAPVVVEAVVVE
jgi:hypothetical protein